MSNANESSTADATEHRLFERVNQFFHLLNQANRWKISNMDEDDTPLLEKMTVEGDLVLKNIIKTFKTMIKNSSFIK